MSDNIVSNPQEWMSNPSKYFMNSVSANPEEKVDIDDEILQDIDKSYTGDFLGYANAIVKTIVIAKQKGILPDVIDKSIKNPEDVAKLATKGAVMADTLVKLATGDIDTYEKLANRIIDTTHVIAISSVELIVQKGLPLAENALSLVVEGAGQLIGTPGLGQVVQQFFDAFAPAIRNGARALLVAGCNKLNKYFKQAVGHISKRIREHLEKKKRNKGSIIKNGKQINKQTEPVTSFA